MSSRFAACFANLYPSVRSLTGTPLLPCPRSRSPLPVEGIDVSILLPLKGSPQVDIWSGYWIPGLYKEPHVARGKIETLDERIGSSVDCAHTKGFAS